MDATSYGDQMYSIAVQCAMSAIAVQCAMSRVYVYDLHLRLCNDSCQIRVLPLNVLFSVSLVIRKGVR